MSASNDDREDGLVNALLVLVLVIIVVLSVALLLGPQISALWASLPFSK